jgi:ribonuclease G
MSKELVISSNRHETRVAMIEDDQLVEIFHQRENEYSLAGSIHKGRVTRVLPGMQSAFVDIGLERDAFLYVSDFFEDNEEYDKIVSSVEEKVLKLDRTPPAALTPPNLVTMPAPAATVESTAAQPGMETVAIPENGASADVPAAVPVEPVDAAAAVAPPSNQPIHHHHPGSGQFGDRGRDDRDRRGGRRGRRRRGGQKGGGARGLPDSKFYSPGGGRPPMGGRPEEVPPPPVVEELGPAAPTTSQSQPPDDFFVLPGESLAKYRHPGDEAAEAGLSDEEVEAVSEAVEMLEAERAVEAIEAVEELSAAVEREVEEVIAEEAAAAEIAAELAPPAAEPLPEPEPLPVDDLESELTEAVTEAAEERVEQMEAAIEEIESGPSALAGDLETDEEEMAEAAAVEMAAAEAAEAEAAEAAEAEIAETGAETAGESELPVDEGPEPARIPTSLTATLREQGPRYLQHRVSRRMRRKGGRPDGRQPQGAPPAPGRTDGRPESRPQEAPRGDQRTVSGPRPAQDGRPEKSGAAPSISDLLREGQEIIVQIAKEPLGQKGARITSHIALPGRFLVYMPTVDHIGVSRKIPSDEERLRLKRVLQNNRTGIPGGYIVRTAGEGRTEEELRADMLFLYNLWLDMRQKAERRPAPMLIHHDLNVVERVLRDQLTSSFKSIWVDNEETYESVLRFVQRFQPALVNRVKLYTRSNPVFDEFNITSELEKALRPKVWLKSGGYIVINQTEALVAIDINTGKYVGKSNRLEDTIVKTNTDAVKEIVRQIRLRDLGGIIVVDFIDMDERKNRQKVMQALEEAMRADRAPYKILQFNDFGLVAITRKRVKQSLERTLCTPCPYCEGAGYVKSPQTLVAEILQEAQKIAKAVEGKDVMLRVNPDVARILKSNQNTYLQELEEILGRTVIVKSDPQLHQEKFDLA